jgi:Tol biopolymer transport system component
MKASRYWLFFIIYLAIFVIGGVVIYYRYLNKYLTISAEPTTIYTATPKGYIYYAQANDLFRLNPSLERDLSFDSSGGRLQSTGQVLSLDISSDNQTCAYSVKNNLGFIEIWKVDLETNESAKIATRGQENLNAYLDFFKPKFNYQGTKLAFLADKEGIQTIFMADKNNLFSELMIPAQFEIADFTWTKDDNNIIYCTLNQSENGCFLQAIKSNSARKIIVGEILKTEVSENNLIFLQKKDGVNNIYSYNLNTGETMAITDLIAPKTVSGFSLNSEMLKIAYEVSDDSGSKEIIASDTNGYQRIVVASGKDISQPTISPDGEQIAVFKNNDGIYTLSTINLSQRKVANIKNYLSILAWR